MKSSKYTYWQDVEFWVGYLEEYPDYMTQGYSLEELKINLADLYNDLTSGEKYDAPRGLSYLDFIPDIVIG